MSSALDNAKTAFNQKLADTKTEVNFKHTTAKARETYGKYNRGEDLDQKGTCKTWSKNCQTSSTGFRDLSGYSDKNTRRSEAKGAHKEYGMARAGYSVGGRAERNTATAQTADAGLFMAGAQVDNIAGAEARMWSAGTHVEEDYGHLKICSAATAGKVQIGSRTGCFIDKTLSASASSATAGTDTELSLKNLTAATSVSAHAGEARAGPFAVRAGVKFGGGIEGGVPVFHAGPVSTPCCIQ